MVDIKISVICPNFFWGDAVGHSAYDYYRALLELGYKQVRGVGRLSNYDDMKFEKCVNLEELLENDWVKSSDLIIYHYAIHDEFLDFLKSNLPGKKIICFHNVTPKKFAPKFAWNIIEKSFEQISDFKMADVIWVVSQENKDELLRLNVNTVPISEIPIAVDRPHFVRFDEKNTDTINIVYVGRFFSSKGILDIVEAMAQVKKTVNSKLILRLVGNTDFSDPEYIAEIKDCIYRNGLGEVVDFVGKVDEMTLARIYREGHIYVTASYHEGFCVPVIESLRAGMIPVTYDAANLKWIANGNGRIVEAGSIDKLAKALSEIVVAIPKALNNKEKPLLPLDRGLKSAREYSDDARAYSAKFSYENFKQRLKKEVLSVLEK